MKVIKRDGRAVDFDSGKIRTAISKANKEVRVKERATKEEVKEIVNYIQELDKKRILVEDIQDIIEQKLMELQKFELSKRYIVYRYTRALVRKQNTTDESILGLIRNENKELAEENSNKNTMLASTQRDYIAGEVSRDLTRRILLPEKISKAHEEGVLYFHNADYFIQPIFNSCIVNIEDMLDNGTVINGKMIESPKSFQVACTVLTRIIQAVGSNQYGEQTIDLIHLGKYLRRSYNKFKESLTEKYGGKISKEILEEMINDRLKEELSSGVQMLIYQINTLTTTNGQPAKITLLLHLEPEHEYAEENAKIIEEILKQTMQGIKNEEGIYETPTVPKLVYVLDENNKLQDEKYRDLTELALKCSGLECIQSNKLKEKGKFNQGIVSINLLQIAENTKENEDEFWKLLDERLELCKETLMCRHYALLGTKSDISPIHWQYGAIARLKKGEKIDQYLYGDNSTLALGYTDLEKTAKIMKNENVEEELNEFESKILKYLNDRVKKWRKETNVGFICTKWSSPLWEYLE